MNSLDVIELFKFKLVNVSYCRLKVERLILFFMRRLLFFVLVFKILCVFIESNIFYLMLFLRFLLNIKIIFVS